MSRALVITAALVLAPIAAALAASSNGAFDWLSGGSASAALFASDVSPAPQLGGSNPTEESSVELGVTGAPLDCPPAGAGPEDSESLFQRQGENFFVRGTLSSFDGATAVVTGPSGDVSATLAPEFTLVGDLSPGSAVEMGGTAAEDGTMTARELRSVCAGAGVIDCITEEDPHFELRIEGDTFEVTGRLDSLTNDMVRVMGPGLIVEIARDSATQIEGGLGAGDPVRVEGTVLDAQQLQALAIALRCEAALAATPVPAAPAAGGQADDDDGDENDNGGERCTRGHRGPGALRFEVDDGEAELKRGAVISWDGASLSVETPVGPVTVLVDEDAEIKGDLDAAVDIRLKGDIQGDDIILAEEIKVLCPAGRGNDGDDKDKDKDKDKEDEDEGEGEDDD